MGLISVLYVAFASISLFACGLQLYISFRKSGDLIFLVSSILSVVIFISYISLLLCLSPMGISCPPFTLLRYQLVLSLAVIISMLGMIFHLFQIKNKLYVLISLSVLMMMIFAGIMLPEQVLFGEYATIRRFSFSQGENLIVLSSGFTLWRTFFDISIAIFLISGLMLMLRRFEISNYKMIMLLFSGLILVLLAAVFDHLIDLGDVHSSYSLPFAFFMLYFILTLIPLTGFIKDMVNQQQILRNETKWQHLVNQANVIVVGLNRMGHVEFINPYFLKLTGFIKEEVIGKDWFEFFIPPKEYYNVQGTFVEVLEYEFHPQYLNPILTKNKEERMIKWFNVRTHDEEGKITGSLSIGVDLTDEIKQQEDLMKRLQEADNLIALLESRLSSLQDHG